MDKAQISIMRPGLSPQYRARQSLVLLLPSLVGLLAGLQAGLLAGLLAQPGAASPAHVPNATVPTAPVQTSAKAASSTAKAAPSGDTLIKFPEKGKFAILFLKRMSGPKRAGSFIGERTMMANGNIVLKPDETVVVRLQYDGFYHFDLFSQFPPDSITQFDGSRLDFDDENIKRLSPFTDLLRLNLDSTLITDKAIATIARFHKLVDLRLSCTDIKGEQFALISSLPLISLNVANCDLNQGVVPKLSGLEKTLLSLNLGKSNLHPEDMTFIEKCTNLNSLDIVGNKYIDDSCTKAICKLKKLENLGISDTLITEKSLAELAKLPKLKRLVIRAKQFWKNGSGKSPRATLQIVDITETARTPIEFFAPLH